MRGLELLFICGSAKLWNQDDIMCASYHIQFHPKIVREASPHQTRVCLVAAGMGITFVPESVQSLVSAEVVCKPVEDVPIQFQFAAAWRQNCTTLTVQKFLELLG